MKKYYTKTKRQFYFVFTIIAILAFQIQTSAQNRIYNIKRAKNGTYNVDTELKVKFNYTSSSSRIRIIIRPYYKGILGTSWGVGGISTFNKRSGKGEAEIKLVDPGTIDEIRFSMYASDTLLLEGSIKVNWIFKYRNTREAAEENLITDNSKTENFYVYPSPATSFFSIQSSDGPFTYKLYNPNGILITEEKNKINEAQVDVNNLNSGVYLLKIDNGIKVIDRKVIVH